MYQKNLQVSYAQDSLQVPVQPLLQLRPFYPLLIKKKIESVDVLLPKKTRIKINIHSCKFGKNNARCSVIKDAGDDPDVTHGAEIVVNLELTSKPNSIEIDGGEGVGRVTKPGIGLEIGQAAINQTPRK